MSQQDLEEFQRTGRMPATRETFVSPTSAFSESYEGRLVEIHLKPGTTARLEQIGVRDSSGIAARSHPEMPLVSRGWTETSAFFKGEGDQVNVGLGRGPALDTFNDSVTGINVIR